MTHSPDKKPKLLFFIFIFTLCGPARAQVISYHLDRKLEYKLDDEHRTAVLYRSDGTAPILLTSYAHTLAEDFYRFVDWPYRHEGREYMIQGRIRNDRYFILNGYSEPKAVPEGAYQLADGAWTLGETYEHCSMYELNWSDNNRIRVYVYDKQDGEDYNQAMEQLLHSISLPALKLGRSEVIVYAEWYTAENPAYPLIGLLERETGCNQDFIINQGDIDAGLDPDPERYRKLHDVKPYPVYCEVIGWNNALDSITTALLTEFFGDMCNYFELYGHMDAADFGRYYIQEAQFLAEHYKKQKRLSRIQSELFLKEAMSHRISNKKENWSE